MLASFRPTVGKSLHPDTPPHRLHPSVASPTVIAIQGQAETVVTVGSVEDDKWQGSRCLQLAFVAVYRSSIFPSPRNGPASPGLRSTRPPMFPAPRHGPAALRTLWSAVLSGLPLFVHLSLRGPTRIYGVWCPADVQPLIRRSTCPGPKEQFRIWFFDPLGPVRDPHLTALQQDRDRR